MSQSQKQILDFLSKNARRPVEGSMSDNCLIRFLYGQSYVNLWKQNTQKKISSFTHRLKTIKFANNLSAHVT